MLNFPSWLSNKNSSYIANISDRYTAYLKVFDNFIRLKHYIVEIVETWNGKLLEATRRKDNDKKKEKPMQADTDKPSGVDDSVNVQTPNPANDHQNDRDRSGCIPTNVKNSENIESKYFFVH